MRAPEPRGRDRQQGPPDLLSRRSVRFLVVGVLALVIGASLIVAVAIGYGQLRRAPDPAREAERAARLRALVREAEATVPAYPGAVRLAERSGATVLGTAPALDGCWQAAAPLADVIAHYRRALDGPGGGGWRVRGTSAAGDLLSAERGQVRLLVHDPAAGAVAGLACPPGTTYAVSLTVFRGPPGQR
jgi:hypothetical protein